MSRSNSKQRQTQGAPNNVRRSDGVVRLCLRTNQFAYWLSVIEEPTSPQVTVKVSRTSEFSRAKGTMLGLRQRRPVALV